LNIRAQSGDMLTRKSKEQRTYQMYSDVQNYLFINPNFIYNSLLQNHKENPGIDNFESQDFKHGKNERKNFLVDRQNRRIMTGKNDKRIAIHTKDEKNKKNGNFFQYNESKH
jgi:hypothetical protein